MIDASEARLVAEMVGIILFTAGGGGAAMIYAKRRANGVEAIAVVDRAANEEVLRQSLHDQRHGETLRILGAVAETSANAARAAERAAEASERAAHSTERLGAALEEHLRGCG